MTSVALASSRFDGAGPSDDLGLVEGQVPATIEDALATTRYWQISRDAFRMALPSGLAFHYRRGRGTVFARGPDVSDAEVALYFDGSVRGAIAWLGGLVPLHVSAVVYEGGIHAFTGASGEGKSTIAAALAYAGFETFCDDVLVVDPAAYGHPVGRRGHVRLKLWRDALALTGHYALDPVRPGADKVFVEGRPAHAEALPLRRLYVLESVPDRAPAIARLSGSDRFNAVRAAKYRPQFGVAALRADRYFELTMRLANAITVRRFSRPRDPTLFAQGLELLIADIRGDAAPEGNRQ